MQVHANDALHEEAEEDASEVDDGNSGTKQECSSRGPSIKLLPATTSTARYLRKFRENSMLSSDMMVLKILKRSFVFYHFQI